MTGPRDFFEDEIENDNDEETVEDYLERIEEEENGAFDEYD